MCQCNVRPQTNDDSSLLIIIIDRMAFMLAIKICPKFNELYECVIAIDVKEY